MTTLEYWLGMAFWAGLMLIIHSGSNKPSKKHVIDKYPNAFWNRK